MTRIAVVLFNLGGPDAPEAVQPFLFNLFNDPAIMPMPWPVRWALAKLIARHRAPTARAIYARLGGGSPLLPNTMAQAAALAAALTDLGEVMVAPCMRYWRPMSDEVAQRVKSFAPDEIVLLPLYPQFSTTTTASSLAAWRTAAARAGLTTRSRALCCYPASSGLVAAMADVTRRAYDRAVAAPGQKPPRILFSAHGLPKRMVERGDPYADHVEVTARAVVERLAIPGLDWKVCYQSRVGPLEWIGPYAEAEIERAGAERIPLVVVPITFVSEHSETLVELDITYRDHARAQGVPHYERAPAIAIHPDFIADLAGLVRAVLGRTPAINSESGARICAPSRGGCALTR